MIESKKITFVVVDVQPKGAYELGHIKGAINFPWSSDITSPGKLPKNKMLILYCDCAHEEDSADTAKQLTIKFGFTNVKTLQGGWSGWQKLGYSMEKGKGKGRGLVNEEGNCVVRLTPALSYGVLEGKTVVLRWNGKYNGDHLLTRIGELLTEKGVKVVKVWEVDPKTAVISDGLAPSLAIADGIASQKPTIVIASQAD
jgi:rhodanese-related sulfurtransferase